MNIGFVSTWFERGASYVTKAYLDLIKERHNVFVYARGGEAYGKGEPKWDLPFVTWSPQLPGTNINFRHFKLWIKKNDIDVVFFNEQNRAEVVYKTKKIFPHIKLGAYIDYYKENTVKEFYLYDFLICNTKRHYSVFKIHPQCYYVPWGTDIELFKPEEKNSDILTFFHSAGMSNRKGTTYVIEAFIDGNIYESSQLVIHTQTNFEKNFGYNVKELEKYNIQVIEKTVSAPGLYYLGDVYVYPTMLDGLGLTMYEALASGLPVITTNHPPMNEVINKEVGYLVDVDYFRSRSDGYYWPLSIINKQSLISGMKHYILNKKSMNQLRRAAREEAVRKWDWKDRKESITDIFEKSKIVVNTSSKELLTQQSNFDKWKQRIGSTYIYSKVYSLFNKL